MSLEQKIPDRIIVRSVFLLDAQVIVIPDSTNGDVFSDYIRTAPKNSRSV